MRFSYLPYCHRLFIWGVIISFISPVLSQNPASNHGNRFEQLGSLLPTPNEYRAADGSPGPKYWQQRADYEINCQLDTEKLKLSGEEKITYYNHSPHTLRYIWLQLDENQHSPDNDNQYFDATEIKPVMSETDLRVLDSWQEKEKYGCKIEAVTNLAGKTLPYTINQTMMRIDLPYAYGTRIDL